MKVLLLRYAFYYKSQRYICNCSMRRSASPGCVLVLLLAYDWFTPSLLRILLTWCLAVSIEMTRPASVQFPDWRHHVHISYDQRISNTFVLVLCWPLVPDNDPFCPGFSCSP